MYALYIFCRWIDFFLCSFGFAYVCICIHISFSSKRIQKIEKGNQSHNMCILNCLSFVTKRVNPQLHGCVCERVCAVNKKQPERVNLLAPPLLLPPLSASDAFVLELSVSPSAIYAFTGLFYFHERENELVCVFRCS